MPSLHPTPVSSTLPLVRTPVTKTLMLVYHIYFIVNDQDILVIHYLNINKAHGYDDISAI